MTTRTFRFYSDPGHGWVRVEKAFLLQIIGDNWRDTFTPFSYERGDFVYLEEDPDAARFANWCRASGIEPVIKPASTGVATRYSRIRTYQSLQPAYPMANNYESGATRVPADCFAPGGAEAAVLINGELQDILEQDDRPEEFTDYYAGCLETKTGGDGSLYLSSGDESFCKMSFEYLVEKLAERKLITKSFGISVAFYCSKLRPDEHGGTYWRALPSGEVLAIGTQLDDLTDEQFRYLVNVRESPATYTSAPDA